MLPLFAGIYYSDDKLLQTRIFSYADTQRHRLGPNYLMLPANAPKGAHHNNHHDGLMNFMHRDEEVCSVFSSPSSSSSLVVHGAQAGSPPGAVQAHPSDCGSRGALV